MHRTLVTAKIGPDEIITKGVRLVVAAALLSLLAPSSVLVGFKVRFSAFVVDDAQAETSLNPSTTTPFLQEGDDKHTRPLYGTMIVPNQSSQSLGIEPNVVQPSGNKNISKDILQARNVTSKPNAANMTQISSQNRESRDSTLSVLKVVQKHTAKTRREMKRLEERLGKRFVTLERGVDEMSLSYVSLEGGIVRLLRSRGGLTLVGDSTTRYLYGFLRCVLDGEYRNNDPDGKACRKTQSQLKNLCNEQRAIKWCEDKASFANENYTDLLLEYRDGYSLGPLSKKAYSTFNHIGSKKHNSSRVVYLGMPCLHSLWSPGNRELSTHSRYSEWPEHFNIIFNQTMDTLGHAPRATFLLGSTNTVCDDNLGRTKRLVDVYLQEQPLSDVDEKERTSLLGWYNKGLDPSQQLHDNYTGLLIPYKDFRANHSAEDFATFDDNGASECTKIGMETFLKNPLSSQNSYLLDMTSATANSCQYSPDGRHYKAPVLLRQVALIIKAAFLSMPK